ncbi:hypothetical protein ACIF8Q_07165 [Streptomyces albidoflavus]
MLRVVYEAADLEPGMIVEIRETRGRVLIRLDRDTRLDDIVPVLNATLDEFLEGRGWFQVWKGEIVSMDSPEDLHGGGRVARIRRGPLGREAS